jgi:sugar phosphate isomerase/epimerase
LQKAKAAAAQFPSICVIMDHFIGDFDADKRKDAIIQMKSLLTVAGHLGSVGAITPASYGMFSRVLPPFSPPRSTQEDEQILLEGLRELGDHAKAMGTQVLLEPLNRYEDHMLNTVAQTVVLLGKLGHSNVSLMADVFHMSIEEVDTPRQLQAAGRWLSHVHLADSNRLEPGSGHTAFAPIFAALKAMNYQGYLSYECMLSGPAERVLAKSVKTLQQLMH